MDPWSLAVPPAWLLSFIKLSRFTFWGFFPSTVESFYHIMGARVNEKYVYFSIGCNEFAPR